MERENLTLDDFLSRFQLLRPQVSREALNQRQAAVLIPVVRREQPGLLLTQRSPFTQTCRSGRFPRRRGRQQRCLADCRGAA